MRVEIAYDRGSRPLNEDTLLTGSDTFGVFDGATGLDGYKDENGKTGGYIAAKIAQSAFFNEREGIMLITRAISANTHIASEMQKRGIDTSDKINRWCTTVSVVRILENRFEWIQTGDSRIIVIYKNSFFKKLPNYSWDDESLTMRKRFAEQGIKNIRALPEMEQEVRRVRRLANVTYGFLNGEQDAIRFLKYGVESLENVSYILLATDGLEIPREDFTKDDIEEIVKLFLEGGLGYAKTHVRTLENSDPECVKYIRFKSHDDIAAIALSF